MLLKKLIHVIILLSTFHIYGQDTAWFVSGKVTDIDSKIGLSNVSIQVINSSNGVLTDSLGNFKLLIKGKTNQLVFSRVGYEAHTITIDSKRNKTILIELKQKLNLLKEIVINSSSVEIVAQSKNSNILTYSFIGKNILLITYRNNLAKSKLVLLNPNFDTLNIINIPEEPTGLFKDCFGDNHIMCENNTYQIYTVDGKLKLLSATSMKDFKNILAPCIASDSANLYFEQRQGAKKLTDNDGLSYNTNNHEITYFYINKKSKVGHLLNEITDDKIIKMQNDETRFEASKKSLGLSTFGDRLFAESKLFKEIAAPLYKIKNLIYIFDFCNNHIIAYNQGKQVKSIDIDFHKTLKWKRELFVDEQSERAYAHFVIDGISELREISLNTGLLMQTTKIPFPFVKNIQVKDNFFYFLYKGQGYDDTRYLSRIKIN